MRIINSEIDFTQVQSDDALLDELGSADPGHHAFVDDYLATLLLSCRREVDAEPIRELVTPALALATVRTAIARRRRGSCA